MDTENKLMVTRWEEIGGLGEKGEGINKYKLVVTKQSWDVKYSLGNTVGTVVITMCGASWVLHLSLRKLYKCPTIMLYP